MLNKLKINNVLNSYKLKVILRYQLNNRHQIMSIIIKNNFDNSIRLYIGVPGKFLIHILNK